MQSSCSHRLVWGHFYLLQHLHDHSRILTEMKWEVPAVDQLIGKAVVHELQGECFHFLLATCRRVHGPDTKTRSPAHLIIIK